MAEGIPVIVNEECEVLKGHCLKSNAGLFYTGRTEFCLCLARLLDDEELRAAMGRNGIEYVEKNYRWDIMVYKISRLIGCAGQGHSEIN